MLPAVVLDSLCLDSFQFLHLFFWFPTSLLVKKKQSRILDHPARADLIGRTQPQPTCENVTIQSKKERPGIQESPRVLAHVCKVLRLNLRLLAKMNFSTPNPPNAGFAEGLAQDLVATVARQQAAARHVVPWIILIAGATGLCISSHAIACFESTQGGHHGGSPSSDRSQEPKDQ